MAIEFFPRAEPTRKISQSPDWSEDALACDHLWMPTSISGDFCCTSDSDCLVSNRPAIIRITFLFMKISIQKHGPRMKCSACKVIAHTICIPIIMDRAQLSCKPSFRDVSLRQYREQRLTHHHWIHRRTEKGKCKQCGKVSSKSECDLVEIQCFLIQIINQSIQAKLSFSSKEIVAISCAWCKYSYHNKESCFNIERIGEECHLGELINGY